MNIKEFVIGLTLRPNMNATYGTMLAGRVTFAVGNLVFDSNRVALGGWLLVIIGIVNYIRWWISYREPAERAWRPWA